MKRRTPPITVVVVSMLFILAGGVGFLYHFTELFEPGQNRFGLLWVLLLRVLAVVCGLLLLRGLSWARYLALAWMLYHVVLGALHSVAETITHLLLLILIAALLFLPRSADYFKNKTDPHVKK